jgi:hypothetical protein
MEITGPHAVNRTGNDTTAGTYGSHFLFVLKGPATDAMDVPQP